MFDLSWSHILLVLIVALVVVGPKDLPRLMRTVGQWTGRARRMADEFRKSFDDMARQSELDELRKEIESLRTERPLAGIEHDLTAPIVPDDMLASAPPPAIPEPRVGELEITDPHPAEPVAAAGYEPPKP
jgi:sec-independent protein translocase protein TatB